MRTLLIAIALAVVGGCGERLPRTHYYFAAHCWNCDFRGRVALPLGREFKSDDTECPNCCCKGHLAQLRDVWK